MAERGTLRLDTGREVRVEVLQTNRDGDEMLVRAVPDAPPAPTADLLTIIDAHLATAAPHAPGTTDLLPAADPDLFHLLIRSLRFNEIRPFQAPFDFCLTGRSCAPVQVRGVADPTARTTPRAVLGVDVAANCFR